MRPPCWTLPVLLSCCSLQFAATVKQKTDHRLYIEVTSSDFQELEASQFEDSDLRNLSHAQRASKTHQGTETEDPVSGAGRSTHASRSKARERQHIQQILDHNLQPLVAKYGTDPKKLWLSPFGMSRPDNSETLTFSGYYIGMLQLFGFFERGALTAMDAGQIVRLRAFIIKSYADALSPDKRDAVQTIWTQIANEDEAVITKFPFLHPESFDPSLAEAGFDPEKFNAEAGPVELSYDEFKGIVPHILGQTF